MSDSTIKYMVMNVKTHMVVLGQDTKVQGCAGYLPVFDSKAEAEHHTDNGRFQIIPIDIKKEA